MERGEAADLLSQLRRDAGRIAERFGLRYRDITAEHPRVTSRYGACYSDGLIKIRLNHARTGRPLRYSSLIDTLCHELAHLKHFNHGPEFKTFYLQLLGWARRQGIYRPRSCRPQADQPERRRGARRPRPPAPERNGVLVFPSWTPAEVERQLPWERLSPAPLPQPSPSRQQLSPAAAAPPSPPREEEAPRPSTPTAADPAEGRQLSLF